MNDPDFIVFLWKLLSDDLFDGDTPSDEQLEILYTELNTRGIIEGEFPA